MADALGLGVYALWRYWPDQGLRNPCPAPELPRRLAEHELVRAVWDTTMALTTGMFRELERNHKLGRAKAVRRSMLALMNDDQKPYFVHPIFWALFVVVGEVTGTDKPRPKWKRRFLNKFVVRKLRHSFTCGMGHPGWWPKRESLNGRFTPVRDQTPRSAIRKRSRS